MNVVELNQVSKHFAAHQVLRGLDLQVPELSVFAFLGNNGAGKSTTIRIMTGLLRPDGGQVRMLGMDIARQRLAILRQVGCLVDSPSLYPNLTAAEFLRIGCAVKGLPQQEIGRVLELVNLQGAKGRIAHFSLGMRQRLALAHALLGTPKLLILDEPGNGLDPQGIHEIRSLLMQLPQRAQCTVFVSSHQLDEVEKMATHLALLKEGRLFCQTSVSQWLAAQTGVLALEVHDAALAARLLQQDGYQVQQLDARNLQVQHMPPQQADRLHARLIGHGIGLFQSVYQKPTLEEWFLQTTTERRAA